PPRLPGSIVMRSRNAICISHRAASGSGPVDRESTILNPRRHWRTMEPTAPTGSAPPITFGSDREAKDARDDADPRQRKLRLALAMGIVRQQRPVSYI